MAVAASHDGVTTAKRKAGLHMSEFGFLPNRLPSASGVTILAGNIQFPVRTLRRAEWVHWLPSPRADR
jgi:hypothetical protein